MTGTIPLLNALAEADRQSLNLLISSKPESPEIPRQPPANRRRASRAGRTIRGRGGHRTGRAQSAQGPEGGHESAVDGKGLDPDHDQMEKGSAGLWQYSYGLISVQFGHFDPIVLVTIAVTSFFVFCGLGGLGA